MQDEEKESSDSELKPYTDYVIVAGGRLVIIGMIFWQIAFSVGQLYSNVWLATEISNEDISLTSLITVYSVVSLLNVVFFYFGSSLVVSLGLKASKSFFHGLISAVMKAPMSFFDSTPSGRILNRVMQHIPTCLPTYRPTYILQCH